MRLFLWIVLIMILTACGDIKDNRPSTAQIKIIHVIEGDRAMDCAVYFQRFSCDWASWNK